MIRDLGFEGRDRLWVEIQMKIAAQMKYIKSARMVNEIPSRDRKIERAHLKLRRCSNFQLEPPNFLSNPSTNPPNSEAFELSQSWTKTSFQLFGNCF